jgi:hypothetical protein
MPLFSTPSPKALALATWQHQQRPYFMAKIERERRKDKAKSGHNDPNVAQSRLIYNFPTYP